MIFNIITLFPEFFNSPLKISLLEKAIKKGLIKVNIYNLRDFTNYSQKQCDDKPFGGGYGMVLMIEPVFNAIATIKEKYTDTKIIYFSPQGKKFNQDKAVQLAEHDNYTILCGHYEGIDNRIIEHLIDYEFSIGDYILTGGEIACMVFIDAMSRLVPGVVQREESVKTDSLSNGLLKYPQYTKPRDFHGLQVPEILISGNHQKIKKWRKEMSLDITKSKRPDLYKKFLKTRCQSE